MGLTCSMLGFGSGKQNVENVGGFGTATTNGGREDVDRVAPRIIDRGGLAESCWNHV